MTGGLLIILMMLHAASRKMEHLYSTTMELVRRLLPNCCPCHCQHAVGQTRVYSLKALLLSRSFLSNASLFSGQMLAACMCCVEVSVSVLCVLLICHVLPDALEHMHEARAASTKLSLVATGSSHSWSRSRSSMRH